jgi:hypothetical protein
MCQAFSERDSLYPVKKTNAAGRIAQEDYSSIALGCQVQLMTFR